MRITWDTPEKRFFSSGLSQGVLYPGISPGVSWNGLISVAETGDQDQEANYLDGRKYNRRSAAQGFSGTISAYTYPDELEPFISAIYGDQAPHVRRLFGFSYRTNREIHLVYNVLLARNVKRYSSSGKQTDPVLLEWNFTTLPVKIPGGKVSSHLVIMVSDSPAITDLEALIYGDDENDPLLPPAEDILEIFESRTILRVTDNGDGTWTATGPDEAITIIDADTFQIDWPSVIFTGDMTYMISSL
jgi:hypothetical protein